MRKMRGFGLGLAAVGLACSGIMVAFADDLDDQEKQNQDQAAALSELQKHNEQAQTQLNSSLEGVNKNLATLYLQLQDTQNKIPVARLELQKAQEEISAARREQSLVQSRLQVANRQLETLAAQKAEFAAAAARAENAIGQLARSTYRTNNGLAALMSIIEAKDSSDFLVNFSRSDAIAKQQASALNFLAQQGAQVKNQEKRQAAAKERVDKLNQQAQSLVDASKAAENKAAEKSAQILALEAQQKQLAGQIEAQKGSINAELSKRNEEAKALAAQVAVLAADNARIAQERARRQAAAAAAASDGKFLGAGVSNPKVKVAALPGKYWGTGLIMPPIPLPMYVTSDWGMRWYPFGGYWMHEGVDLRSPCGANLVAAASGVVSSIRYEATNDTHGNQIFINHGQLSDGNSYVTVYNHLQDWVVEEGQWVEQGQLIAHTGATGMVTGCHLHFEVWRNGQVIDPMELPGFIEE